MCINKIAECFESLLVAYECSVQLFLRILEVGTDNSATVACDDVLQLGRHAVEHHGCHQWVAVSKTDNESSRLATIVVVQVFLNGFDGVSLA